MVAQALAVAVATAGQAADRHARGQVLPLDVACVDLGKVGLADHGGLDRVLVAHALVWRDLGEDAPLLVLPALDQLAEVDIHAESVTDSIAIGRIAVAGDLQLRRFAVEDAEVSRLIALLLHA